MDHLLHSLVESIRARPGIYFGKPSVIRLHAFLGGYFVALFDFNLQATPQPDELWEFADWIYAKYSIKESIGWDQVLLEAAGDDHAAFLLFEELWDEFLSIN